MPLCVLKKRWSDVSPILESHLHPEDSALKYKCDYISMNVPTS